MTDSGRDWPSDVRAAWETNHRINAFLLEGISEEGLRCTLSTRGGRDVARQFAHIHHVRIYQLEKRAPDLAESLEKFPSKYSPPRDALLEALDASAEAVGAFLQDLARGEAPGGARRRGMRKGVFTTFGYLVAHEAHHRGSILLTLKQSGHMPAKEVVYGIWDWDRR